MCPALRVALSATCVLLLLFLGASPAAAADCLPGTEFIHNLHATGGDGSSFSFAWDPLPSALSGPVAASMPSYEVMLFTGSSYCHFSPAVVAATTTETSYTIPLSTPDAAYAVYVRAHGTPCLTSESMLLVDSFTSAPSKPFVPGVFIDDHTVTLEFEYRDERAFGVEVERTGSDGEFHYVATLPMCAEGPKIFTQQVPDGHHTYRVAVSNASTRATMPVYSNTITADVGVTGLPDVRFAASPSVIPAGAAASLAFETKDATSVTIDNGLGPQPFRGSVAVSPSVTTAYTLTASNSVGSVTSIVTVSVTAPARRRGVHP